MVELRLDLLQEPDRSAAERIREQIDLPMILTCRRKQDGGRWTIGERNRYRLLESCIDLGWEYIDLEEDCRKQELESAAAEHGVKIIRSYHDISGVPDNLFTRIVKLKKRGDIAKIAVTPRNIDEVRMIFRVEKELESIHDKVVIGMGDFGIPTRILYKRTGSVFTFCSPAGSTAASGHLSAEHMAQLYRSDHITSDTKIFGIIGNPVMHTSSPLIHNPAFIDIGINAVYIPFLVDDVRGFFQLADMLPIQGFSVTVPHKQQVLPYLGRISREVKLIGSCNTVVKTGSLWKGLNTDFYGFLKPIEDRLENSEIKRAVVIGAGGGARAVVWALRNYGCKVTILNRTVEKAEKLAQATGSDYGGLEMAGKLKQTDLIVQTTSAGMSPFEGIDPVPLLEFTGREIVYDLVYKPQDTAFLKRAIASGCQVVYGIEMLVGQGIKQFEAFTGMHYPDHLHPLN
jgi:3-dehydroquinate dehydratase/shikimate dehydrogenase